MILPSTTFAGSSTASSASPPPRISRGCLTAPSDASCAAIFSNMSAAKSVPGPCGCASSPGHTMGFSSVGINLFHAAKSFASISTSSTSSSSSPHASSSSSMCATSSSSTRSSSPMRDSKSNAGLAPSCRCTRRSRSSSSSSSRPISKILRELFESTNLSSSFSSLLRFWRLAGFDFHGSEGAYSSARGLCRCCTAAPGDLGAFGIVGVGPVRLWNWRAMYEQLFASGLRV